MYPNTENDRPTEGSVTDHHSKLNQTKKLKKSFQKWSEINTVCIVMYSSACLIFELQNVDIRLVSEQVLKNT